jgi:hypothetical protein
MRLYLAGPMTGHKESNFPAFNTAAAELRGRGHTVFNPAEKDIEKHGHPLPGETSKDYETRVGFNLRAALGADLAWICEHADGIALLLGWERSKGANAENATAVALGLKRMFQDVEGEWVEAGQMWGIGQ